MKWKLIKTCPKIDGELFLLYDARDGTYATVYWREEYNAWCEQFSEEKYGPIWEDDTDDMFWMPLPKPPKEAI